jgi:hypothetical protein
MLEQHLSYVHLQYNFDLTVSLMQNDKRNILFATVNAPNGIVHEPLNLLIQLFLNIGTSFRIHASRLTVGAIK